MIKFKGAKVSDPVLYFHGGVCEQPFPAIVVEMYATGMAKLSVFMDGLWRTKNSVFHRDSEKLKDNPKMALANGMWMPTKDFDEEQEFAAMQKAEAKAQAVQVAQVAVNQPEQESSDKKPKPAAKA